MDAQSQSLSRDELLCRAESPAPAGPSRAPMAAAVYQAVARSTCPPRGLQAVLYESLLHTCRAAQEALAAADRASATTRLRKAGEILSQLRAGSVVAGAEADADRLRDLYGRVLARLEEAVRSGSADAMAEAIQWLDYRREEMRAFLAIVAEETPVSTERQSAGWVG